MAPILIFTAIRLKYQRSPLALHHSEASQANELEKMWKEVGMAALAWRD
jgi:hypothetical protein